MKTSRLIIGVLICLVLAIQTYAQSGVPLVSVSSKNNTENRVEKPSLPEGKNLSFGGKFTGTEDSFTFGIIADRHGGNPLVGWPYFEQAIREMNFLHPDFVIMPGDLIDGYIRREGAAEDFNEQFDQFARFVNKLEMPLYFVAGNHDLSNNEMKDPFLKRFGMLWYSFDYRDVHFIALCTEAQPGGKDQQHHFTEEQVEWAISDIASSKDTRHTVIIMHYPAWHSRNRETLMYRQWIRIEDMLKGRKYTVIAGHTHDLSTTIRNGRPYYVMATSGGSQSKPHSFYHGNTHHTGLVKMEGDSLYLSILELGTTHSMEQVSKTRKSPENIKTIQSLKSYGKGFQAEFSANITNPQAREIFAEFSLQGLSPKGWKSSAGDRMTTVIAPGDSFMFRTVLTISDPMASFPPLLNITAEDNGLKIVEHSDEVPVFKKDDYRTISKWYSAAPFDGSPMTYIEPPFDPRRTLPAMFKDHGPEIRSWNPDDKFSDGIGWKKIMADEKGRVDFGKVYGYLISPVGYAITFVDSPDERMVYLRFSVNDYGRVWINGETVGEDIFFWEDGTVTFPVWLKKGRNSIMVKSANWSNNWYFTLKMSDPDHSLLIQ